MRGIIVVLTLVATFAAGRPLPGSARCSKALFQFGLKGPATAYVLGTPRSDTALAGGGAVGYQRFRADTARPIYGQLFTAERIGGPPSAALPRGGSSVVIVPWSYGASCEPIRWTQSARWLTPGERGLIIGELRDPRSWIDGVPTIDVHLTQVQPYPQRVFRNPPSETDTTLTAGEAFDLLDAMPDWAAFERSTDDAIAPLRRWVSANPALARRRPANAAISRVEDAVEHALLERIVSPVTGTWRFTLARPGRDSAVFFVRTDRRPSRTWNYQRTDSGAPFTRVRAPDDYYLHAATAMSERELPTQDGDWTRYREGYVGIVRDPRTRADGSQEWIGRLELEFIEDELFGDVDIRDDREEKAVQGSFVMDRQGRIHAEFTVGKLRGRPLVFRGERVSTTTIDRD